MTFEYSAELRAKMTAALAENREHYALACKHLKEAVSKGNLNVARIYREHAQFYLELIKSQEHDFR